VSHSNLNRRMIEIRFDKHMTIEDVKFKLHKHTGTPSHSQRLVLKDGGQVCAKSLLLFLRARRKSSRTGVVAITYSCSSYDDTVATKHESIAIFIP